MTLYLRDKVSDEGDVRVELLQTPADVAHHGQHVAAAQQVHHAVQQSLLQLQLQQRSEFTTVSHNGRSWQLAIISSAQRRVSRVSLGTAGWILATSGYTWVPPGFTCTHLATPGDTWVDLLTSGYTRFQRHGDPHLLHDVQLGVLRLKELDEQLEHLGVQQLVAGADLGSRGWGNG